MSAADIAFVAYWSIVILFIASLACIAVPTWRLIHDGSDR